MLTSILEIYDSEKLGEELPLVFSLMVGLDVKKEFNSGYEIIKGFRVIYQMLYIMDNQRRS